MCSKNIFQHVEAFVLHFPFSSAWCTSITSQWDQTYVQQLSLYRKITRWYTLLCWSMHPPIPFIPRHVVGDSCLKTMTCYYYNTVYGHKKSFIIHSIYRLGTDMITRALFGNHLAISVCEIKIIHVMVWADIFILN